MRIFNLWEMIYLIWSRIEVTGLWKGYWFEEYLEVKEVLRIRKHGC